jgi:hypothetical protein
MKFTELYESLITEKKHTLYVYDGEEAVKGLKKVGVKAKEIDNKGDNYDHVVIDLKDKEKVFQWMLDNGFEADEVDAELGGTYESVMSEKKGVTVKITLNKSSTKQPLTPAKGKKIETINWSSEEFREYFDENGVTKVDYFDEGNPDGGDGYGDDLPNDVISADEYVEWLEMIE